MCICGYKYGCNSQLLKTMGKTAAISTRWLIWQFRMLSLEVANEHKHPVAARVTAVEAQCAGEEADRSRLSLNILDYNASEMKKLKMVDTASPSRTAFWCLPSTMHLL